MYRIVMVACMYQEDAEAKKSRKKNAGNVAQSQLEDSLSIKDIVGNYRSDIFSWYQIYLCTYCTIQQLKSFNRRIVSVKP